MTAARTGRRRRPGALVPSCDAFFLHVEDTWAAQHVGGLVVFDPVPDPAPAPAPGARGHADAPSVARVREVIAGELDRMPRFRQRLLDGQWRRPRWVDVDHLDWSWHVVERRSADGVAGLWRVVAEFAEAPLPRDRPLWRSAVVHDVGAGQSGFVIVMHHAVADGIGTIRHTLRLMRPSVDLPTNGAGGPGRAERALATGAGLAQLATDGWISRRLGASSPRRDYATAALDLATFQRVVSTLGTRFTDLLLALVATAAATTHPNFAAQVAGRLRVAVPLMARAPGEAIEGNATAAVMLDVPVDGRPFADLLTEVGRRTARLRRPTRALASRFVMTGGLRLLPEPWAGWFARTVYGRRFFHAIATNLPGPTQRLTLGGVGLQQVYPILPLAPGSPLAMGAMSWAGALGFGIATDPEVLDAGVLAARVAELFEEITGRHPADSRSATGSGERPHQREEQPRA